LTETVGIKPVRDQEELSVFFSQLLSLPPSAVPHAAPLFPERKRGGIIPCEVCSVAKKTAATGFPVAAVESLRWRLP
jgi:hypothetical protein